MLDISEVKTHTQTSITIRFTGAPEHGHRYSSVGRRFLPQYAKLTYEYDTARQWWTLHSASISGPFILKPGPDGAQRLGKDHGKSEWYGFTGRDLQEGSRDPLPMWLDELASELRPHGILSLPGGA